jgi:hypothetical protein
VQEVGQGVGPAPGLDQFGADEKMAADHLDSAIDVDGRLQLRGAAAFPFASFAFAAGSGRRRRVTLVLGELEQGLVRLGLDTGLGLNVQGRRLRNGRSGNQHGGAQARPDLPFLHGFPLATSAAAG